MEITFLKDHLNFKENETVEIPDNIALYLLRCRVATVLTDGKEIDDTLTGKLKKTKKKK